MKALFILFAFTLFLFASNENNTTKEKKILQKEDNSETIKAIEDFMKKYSKVTKGC
jgi:YbbR domain-containing protein